MSQTLSYKQPSTSDYCLFAHNIELDGRIWNKCIPLDVLKHTKIANLYCAPLPNSVSNEEVSYFPVYGLLKASPPFKFEQFICIGALPFELTKTLPTEQLYHLWKLILKNLWVNDRGIIKSTLDIYIKEEYFKQWQDALRTQSNSNKYYYSNIK
ncbi:hypothetical protein [Pleionea sp. CnH1-48]|uniref:hypothetical protein n=1 Tax=Pleionea sp. CnH1-48 TaxID=2954494 RepID=UPI0020974464|nr:hypothetical protein [Pleionea sp. CnH1-48]MCO7227528.1 hypothetical protein [Pleionea sp. CnH1-48]